MHVSMNKPTLALKIAFVLAMMTLAGAAVSATRAADIEARAHPNGAVGAAPFSTIPNLSASDFADSSGINSVSASVVTGSLHPVSGPFSKLFDGQWPATWDSPGDTVFDLQRLGVNLNGSVDLSQINTYSRHVTSRTPQSYTLYGSNAILAPDGTGTPGDLITNGWTQIDSVDTTGASPPNGTNTALAGIAGASANGSLGQFRHLLFDLSTSGSGGAFAGTFYGELDIQGTVQSGAKATFESRTHNPPGNVGTGAIVGSPFTRITNLSNTDFADASQANGVTFSLEEGTLHPVSAPLSVLNDGAWASTNDDINGNAFALDSMHLMLDLGGLVSVEEVNTFSRHVSTRTPQEYTLLGFDGLVAPDATGDIDALLAAGWEAIAEIDTTGSGDTHGTLDSLDGIAGVNILNSDGSALGEFRFLLFDIQNTGNDTFFSEIDVVGAAVVPEPHSIAIWTILGLVGLGYTVRRRAA